MATIDYKALVAARQTLKAAAEALDEVVWYLVSPVDARHISRVMVLSEVAEDAIFDVLNAAHSYLEDHEAGAAIGPPAGYPPLSDDVEVQDVPF